MCVHLARLCRQPPQQQQQEDAHWLRVPEMATRAVALLMGPCREEEGRHRAALSTESRPDSAHAGPTDVRLPRHMSGGFFGFTGRR